MYGCDINGPMTPDSCKNGNPLLADRRCDGWIECSDNSDEGENCLASYGCCTGSLNATFHNLLFEYDYGGFDKSTNRPYYVAQPFEDAQEYILFYGNWVGHHQNCGKVPGTSYWFIAKGHTVPTCYVLDLRTEKLIMKLTLK